MYDYDWDPQKAQSNLRKHGISFADATTVLEDDRALTIEDEGEAEQRFITVGRDSLGRILVVVFTFRRAMIRIISARKATARERLQYEENQG